MARLSFTIAFAAGLLSFLSPCILPLIPSYILFLTGISLHDYRSSVGEARLKTLINALFFIIGFSLVFIALGATASALGQALMEFRGVIRVAGGVIVIGLGLFLLKVIRLDFLQAHFGWHYKFKPGSYLGAFVFGMAFSAAWVPCAGPILGSILVLASVSSTMWNGVLLLGFYSLGLAIPFLLTALLLDLAIVYIKKMANILHYVEIISGILLILIGLMILTNSQQVVSIWLSR